MHIEYELFDHNESIYMIWMYYTCAISKAAGKTADRVGRNKAMHAGYYIGYTLAC